MDKRWCYLQFSYIVVRNNKLFFLLGPIKALFLVKIELAADVSVWAT